MKRKLGLSDIYSVAIYGIKARKGRSIMTSIGIGIGIAAIVAVIGISASGKADLIATLESLGTNLIKASPTSGFFGTQDDLPKGVLGMVERIGPVEEVTATTQTDLLVRRSKFISELEGGGISVIVTTSELLDVVGGSLVEGRFIEAGLSNLPVVTLGSVTAKRLGISNLDVATKILINNEWFGVIGILEKLSIHPDLDRSAFIGYGVAKELFDIDSEPSTIYLRANPTYVEEVVDVLAPTMNPENPDQVEVSRPSDALEAQQAAEAAFTSLLLGLGSVALLVGGVAIANVMVMSVLERRMEIGVRRSIGATRSEIRSQFLLESILLAGFGGLVGVLLGAGITIGYTRYASITFSIPVWQVFGAIILALVIGALAGLYPAIRASKVQPAEAVRS